MQPNIVIACGGTGGHLYPGVAVAQRLMSRGCRVTLILSEKEVDRRAASALEGLEIRTLPAVGLQRMRRWHFVASAWRSFRICRSWFDQDPPHAILSMGGFMGLGPVLAGRRRSLIYLHDSNSIPGRATRWLGSRADHIMLGFNSAAERLAGRSALMTGTPVRNQLRTLDPGACHQRFGFDPERPVLLVTGGSQGAAAINDLMRDAIPWLAKRLPELQYIHLTGAEDNRDLEGTYSEHGCVAEVYGFLSDIHLALGAATVCVSRAGGATLAELAAVRLPALLLPFPQAADDHQLQNAKDFAESGAACWIPQRTATPEEIGSILLELLRDEKRRRDMSNALAQRDIRDADERIAGTIMNGILERWPIPEPLDSKTSPPIDPSSPFGDRAEMTKSVATIT